MKLGPFSKCSFKDNPPSLFWHGHVPMSSQGMQDHLGAKSANWLANQLTNQAVYRYLLCALVCMTLCVIVTHKTNSRFEAKMAKQLFNVANISTVV